MDEQEFEVGAVAELAGVSISVLHHYDRLGLLQPSSRNSAGYRLYSVVDMQRLYRVAFYRELGLTPGEITDLLADPAASDEDHLHRQRDLVTDRITHFQAMLELLDRELAAGAADVALTPQERRKIFGDARFTDKAPEGRKESFIQHQERTRGYTYDDWLRLREEMDVINRELADAVRDGVLATDRVAMDIAERHRLHTDHWFHDCDHDTHLNLSHQYRANRRRYRHSGRNYGDLPPDLAEYLHESTVANHRRATSPM